MEISHQRHRKWTDCWEPFGEDTPEAAAAWAAGRQARVDGCVYGYEHGEIRPIDLSPWIETPELMGGHVPSAKELGLFPENQTLRIEWEIGWDYQDRFERGETEEEHLKARGLA